MRSRAVPQTTAVGRMPMRSALGAIDIDDVLGLSERSGREVRFAFGPWAQPPRRVAETTRSDIETETEEDTDA